MGKRLRWGIMATGAIADRFASELRETESGHAVAVASRTTDRAEAFARAHGIERAHGDYQSLVDDENVDVVYIATPHPQHAQWAVRAAEAGKHILCEKPLTLHAADAEAVLDAARRHGVFLMEAFMYRCHPQTQRLLELVEGGVLGELRVIEAVHSFRGPADPEGRLLANDLGGGGILDVGCYTMSAARLLAGVAFGAEGAIEPDHLSGTGHLVPSGVDGWAVASLSFASGVIAHLSCGVLVDQPPALRLHGTEASLELLAPWLPGIDGARSHEITIHRTGHALETINVASDRGIYAIEADHVAACVSQGAVESPAMPWSDTFGNMVALDRWRRAVGVTYERERPRRLTTAVHGRPLVPSVGGMPRHDVSGVRLPLSCLVLGTMLAEGDHAWPTAMAVFDAFFEAGGNVFDSARRYGRGESDRALGHWMESRGVRGETVVIAKGAHTPHCDPETVTRELVQSLDDLRTDRADLYFLHRDNLDVPVGEFVDVLNEHRDAGRIAAFGGSNWTAARIDAANAYAEARGLAGFTTVSNQFSLARMLKPTFPGCVGANDPEWRDWLTRTQVPLVAWSSQAGGFFAERDPRRMRHAWHDATNLERRRRAAELGARLGHPATTVALAWVLAQPLPILPVIGPRSLAELRASLGALELARRLSAHDLAWLDLEVDEPRA